MTERPATKWSHAALLTSATLVALAGCGGAGDDAVAPAEPAPAVLGAQDVIVVEQSDIAAGVRFTASLEPGEVVDVKAQVAGTIRDLAVDRGTAVERGSLMTRIEAEGVRGEAAGARASIAAAQAALAEARQRLQGARTLYEAGALAEVDFRGAEAQFEAAQAQLAAAEAQFAGASESVRRATVEAPIDGVVSARDVSEGEAVATGQQLFTIVNSAVLELSGQVSVQAAQQVQAGQRVEFSLDAYPGQVFAGTVARVDPVADPATRRVGITVELPNLERGLIAGQFVTGTILAGGMEQGLLVPQSGVRGAQSAPFVLVVEGDRVVRRPVTVDARPLESAYVAIASGLREGDTVIVTPATTLAEGTRVRIDSPPESARL